jgi:DNA polymerase I-like protein with 3'-5' exonuclease and polymerase domains
MADWQPPTELPDLRNAGIIALDTETRDGGLAADRGSAWPWGDGHICGIAAAWRSDGAVKSCYVPIKHPDSKNFDDAQVFAWLRDLIASDVRFATHNGVYDWGWLRTEAGVQMPPPARMEEIGALATLVDENRHKYSLESLCAWRGLPGKDETLLKEGAELLGVRPKDVKSHLWRLPAHYVGPYAETDAARTLELFESLDPIINQEGTLDAYRLECDLLPMVLEMRRRGIRVDQTAAEHARDLILKKRDAALSELSDKLEAGVAMQNLRSPRWLAAHFDAHRLTYPRTEKDNPSFKGEWLRRQHHWLPQLIATASKYDRAGTVFLEKHVLANVINGRIHAEIYPHRSEDNGTRSFRFSYADPPLQQMPKRNEELATLIRAAFLPEPGDAWVTLDASQQEFRLLVHYAAALNLTRAKETVERYQNDPKTDYHTLVADLTGLDRSHAKGVNFAKIYGAGPRKLAQMIGVSEGEARAMMCKYDGEMPFAKQLAKRCERAIWNQGYLTLYGGARRHWETIDNGGRLVYASTYKGLNALIQGSAAYHTKLWMRLCWRAGVVPMLQMHDALECSIASQELTETVARLGSEAVSLNVPMLIDVHCGRTWADAKHTWEELRSDGADGPFCETKEEPPPFEAGPEPQPEAPTESQKEGSNAMGDSGRPTNRSIGDGDSAPIEMSGDADSPVSMAERIRHTDGAGAASPRVSLEDMGAQPATGGKITCPFHDDRTPSLQIYADGHYHCFGCGKHGSVAELPEAPDPPGSTGGATNYLDRAHHLWGEARPIEGTLAERYLLETRRIASATVSELNGTLRFHPACPFDGIHHPCLLALFVDVFTDEPAGIHRVALTADAQKIGRMMLGSWKPRYRAIKLLPGSGRLTIGEGIETVLAAKHAAGGGAMWAMGSAASIGTLPILPGFTRLSILVDNDANGVGSNTARICGERWRAQQRSVRLLTPRRSGADFNDLSGDGQ